MGGGAAGPPAPPPPGGGVEKRLAFWWGGFSQEGSSQLRRKRRFLRRSLLGASAVVLVLVASPGWGDVAGVADERILFGQSAAFSGPAEQLGRDMRLGIEAAFAEANANGGIHGRRLTLLSRDDAYEPEAAIANTRRLIEEDGVFALIGAVGTPTSRSAAPVAEAAGVPYIAPFTGAEFLRSSELQSVVNLRASYYQETEAMVAHLIEDLDIRDIAVMRQDDSFGLAGYNGVRLAMERRDMELAATAVYRRNTTAVKTGVLDLMRAAPGAVILIGAYEPVAATIAWSRHLGFDPVFLTISFVGSNALAGELGARGDGVFVTQVVPLPSDDLDVVRAYRNALAAVNQDAAPGFVSLEGYLAGRLAIVALEGAGAEITRARFLETLHQAGAIDMGGFQLEYGTDDNQGSDEVFVTVIDPGGSYRSVTNLAEGRR
ncbi:MAG: ABC transporter substrate-binding protein [Gammaproteobacteria bacterium]|nr:ABC transporter substrate-binding protein [Gammaproteobacteria bacterium]